VKREFCGISGLSGLLVFVSEGARIRCKAVPRRNDAADGDPAVVPASKTSNPLRCTAILQPDSDRIRSPREEKAGLPRSRSPQADTLPENPLFVTNDARAAAFSADRPGGRGATASGSFETRRMLVRRGGRPDRWIEPASLIVGQMTADAASLLAGEANVTLSQVGSVVRRQAARTPPVSRKGDQTRAIGRPGDPVAPLIISGSMM
jgi:hypothetical protein